MRQQVCCNTLGDLDGSIARARNQPPADPDKKATHADSMCDLAGEIMNVLLQFPAGIPERKLQRILLGERKFSGAYRFMLAETLCLLIAQDRVRVRRSPRSRVFIATDHGHPGQNNKLLDALLKARVNLGDLEFAVSWPGQLAPREEAAFLKMFDAVSAELGTLANWLQESKQAIAEPFVIWQAMNGARNR
jgi:hypothetical protein